MYNVKGSFRGQTLERGIATPDSLDQDKVIHKQLVGSVGRLSWDGVNRKYSDFSQDPSAESSTSLISEDEERRVSRRNRLLMVIVLILILVFGACVALYLGLTFGKGQVKDVVVSNEPELQSLTMNIRIANWFYAGDYEDRDTQRFVEAQNKICTSVAHTLVSFGILSFTSCTIQEFRQGSVIATARLMFDDDPKEGLVMTMLRLGISRGEVRGEKVFEGMEISELTVGTIFHDFNDESNTQDTPVQLPTEPVTLSGVFQFIAPARHHPEPHAHAREKPATPWFQKNYPEKPITVNSHTEPTTIEWEVHIRMPQLTFIEPYNDRSRQEFYDWEDRSCNWWDEAASLEGIWQRYGLPESCELVETSSGSLIIVVRIKYVVFDSHFWGQNVIEDVADLETALQVIINATTHINTIIQPSVSYIFTDPTLYDNGSFTQDSSCLDEGCQFSCYRVDLGPPICSCNRGSTYVNGQCVIATSSLYTGYDSGQVITITTKEDDVVHGPLDVQYPMPFGEHLHSSFYISTNGLVTFGAALRTACASEFPLDPRFEAYVVAPLWADFDMDPGTAIYYVTQNKDSVDKTLLTQAKADVCRYLGQNTNCNDFEPTSLITVTWFKASLYGVFQSGIQSNTIQATIVHNISDTFMIYNYDGLTNLVSGYCGTRYQIGFDATHTEEGSYNSPLSGQRTGTETSLVQESNINVSGRWVYHVTNDIDEDEYNVTTTSNDTDDLLLRLLLPKGNVSIDIGDDASFKITVSEAGLRAFNRSISDSLYIHSNGYLTFEEVGTTANCEEVGVVPIVFGLYADYVPSMSSGNIYVREFTEGSPELNDTIREVACDLLTEESDECEYEPTFAVAITFYRIQVLRGMDATTESTFQIVLVTDGESDALVFLSFDKVNIDLDNGLCSRAAGVIWPDGIEELFEFDANFEVNVLTSGSNIGRPGIFGFRLSPSGPEVEVELFDFGFDAGDQALPEGEDLLYGPIIFKDGELPIFGTRQEKLYISVNGIVQFYDIPWESWCPNHDNRGPGPILKPFNYDLTTELGESKIYFRETTKPEELTLVTQQACLLEGPACDFVATWAFIITFYKMKPSEFVGGSEMSPTNTFQVVLATDGTRGFGFYLYKDIKFGMARFGDVCHFQAGYESILGHDHYRPEFENMEDILSLRFDSNVGAAGVWIFDFGESQSANDTWLYPFGNSVGDDAMVRRDFGYDLIPLPSQLPLWGNNYEKIYISPKGSVSFDEGVVALCPLGYLGNTIISVYAGDWDLRRSAASDVFYRVENVTGSESMTRARSDVCHMLNEGDNSKPCDFEPSMLVIITWNKMVDWSPFFEPDDFFALDPALYYYFYDEIDYVVVSTKELNESYITAQLVLATDGDRSFGVFSYDDLDIPSCEIPMMLQPKDPELTVVWGWAGYALADYTNIGRKGQFVWSLGNRDYCEDDPCSNGECILHEDGSGFICECDEEWTGPLCNISIYYDPCTNNPCGDGNTCNMLSPFAHTCVCADAPTVPALSCGTSTCEAIDVDICAEYLPYSNTKLPNLLGDATQLDAQNAISATLAKVDTHCFETAARFFCALYFPRCDDGGTVTQVCRSNCDAYRYACSWYDSPLDPKVPCVSLPDSLRYDNCTDLQQPQDLIPVNNNIRLVGGIDEGRVEVFYDGKWGTVCHEGFDVKDAMVICRSMGFEGSATPLRFAHYNSTEDIIQLTDLDCEGDENYWQMCEYEEDHECQHDWDAGVMCRRSVDCDFETEFCGAYISDSDPKKHYSMKWSWVAATAGNGMTVPMVDGSGNANGHYVLAVDNPAPAGLAADVEIKDYAFLASPGLHVLDDGACFSFDFYLNGDGAALHLVMKRGEEGSPLWKSESASSEWQHASMTLEEGYYYLAFATHNVTGMTIAFDNVAINYEEICGKVRLVEGENYREGIVEIFRDGKWGRICDEEWTNQDASTVCGMLGMSNGTAFAVEAGEFEVDGEKPDVIIKNPECECGDWELWDCKWEDEECEEEHSGVGVRCDVHETEIPEMNLTVSLVGGFDGFEGILVATLNGVNGTVCASDFDEGAAMAACKMIFPDTVAVLVHEESPFEELDMEAIVGKLDCPCRAPGLGACDWEEPECEEDSFVSLRCLVPSLLAGQLNDGGSGGGTAGSVFVMWQGVWGSICDDHWDDDDAAVVCAMAGHDAAGAKAYGGGYFAPAPENWTIWLDDVGCEGDETSLLSCDHRPWGESNCGHFEDAGVVCNDVAGEYNLSVRLVNPNNVPGRGMVQVKYTPYDENWHWVCDDFFDEIDAKVICESLGFDGGFSMALGNAFYGSDESLTCLLDDIECYGDYIDLRQCGHRGLGVCDCQPNEAASVVCNLPGRNLIRLTGGGEDSGRVEVNHAGVWGTICGRGWDHKDAAVVCRTLGFDEGYAIASTESFGDGPNPTVWATQFECSGDEEHLFECRHADWGLTDCFGNEHLAIVQCEQEHEPIEVELKGGNNDLEGIVQLTYNGEEGGICALHFNDQSASMICRMLTRNPEAKGKAIFWAYFANSETLALPHWLNNMGCPPDAKHIDDCHYEGWGEEQFSRECRYGYAAVTCNERRDIQARLHGGPAPNEGLLEVYQNDQWIPVCDNDFTDDKAETICRHFGFQGDATILEGHEAYGFPHDMGRFAFRFKCIVDSHDLHDCQWLYSDDDHPPEDCKPVSVRCEADIPVHARGCDHHPVIFEACQSVPWEDRTFLNRVDQLQLQETFDYHRMHDLFSNECYDHAGQFLCSFLVGECNPQYNIVYPCRSLCEGFVRGCLDEVPRTFQSVFAICAYLPAENTRETPCIDEFDDWELGPPSSEDNGECKDGQVPCFDGTCIREDWVCDGVNDCRPINSDELGCEEGDGIPCDFEEGFSGYYNTGFELVHPEEDEESLPHYDHTVIGKMAITEDGEPCALPYIYVGHEYHGCTTTNNGDQPWCAVWKNFTEITVAVGSFPLESWANCALKITIPEKVDPPVTVDGKPCIVPFEYDGEEYEGCKMKDGVSYCPVWENCTEGECGEEDWPEEAWGICKHNLPKVCQFPFRYKGEDYDECTDKDRPHPWCATNPECEEDCDYSDKDNYGYCFIGGMAVMRSEETHEHEFQELLSLPVEDIENVGCFYFHYYHKGEQAGPLKVYFLNEDHEYEEVWTTEEEWETEEWTRGYIDVKRDVKRIAIRAYSTGRPGGDIALDDFGLDNKMGCIPDGYEVELIESESDRPSGYLVMSALGEHGLVCGLDWGPRESKVACRDLGFEAKYGAGAAIYDWSDEDEEDDEDEEPMEVFISGVRCTGEEESLSQCNHEPYGEPAEECRHKRAVVWLYCIEEEQEFRLTRNEEYGEGVLEAFFEDHWFQFNAEYWNEEAAVVACRTLGFNASSAEILRPEEDEDSSSSSSESEDDESSTEEDDESSTEEDGDGSPPEDEGDGSPPEDEGDGPPPEDDDDRPPPEDEDDESPDEGGGPSHEDEDNAPGPPNGGSEEDNHEPPPPPPPPMPGAPPPAPIIPLHVHCEGDEEDLSECEILIGTIAEDPFDMPPPPPPPLSGEMSGSSSDGSMESGESDEDGEGHEDSQGDEGQISEHRIVESADGHEDGEREEDDDDEEDDDEEGEMDDSNEGESTGSMSHSGSSSNGGGSSSGSGERRPPSPLVLRCYDDSYTPPPNDTNAVFPTCGFDDPEDPGCGVFSSVIVDPHQDLHWLWSSGPTHSHGTGPSHDATFGGKGYLYFEASGPAIVNTTGHLKSSTFTASASTCVRFNYHMFGEGVGSLEVVLISEGTGVVESLAKFEGDHGPYWNSTKLAMTHSGEVSLAFVATRGPDHEGDIAIDDVTITTSCADPCADGFSPCDDGFCIPDYVRCNNFHNCPDKSDEIGCPCKNGTQACQDGICLNEIYFCDGLFNCKDNSDEMGCRECDNTTEFQCALGHCIKNESTCDGMNDCMDWSDENSCECDDDMLHCDSGGCFEEDQLCNFEQNCEDGSDEKNCSVECDYETNLCHYQLSNDFTFTWAVEVATPDSNRTGSYLKADANLYGEWAQAKSQVFMNEEESCLMFEYIANGVMLGVSLQYFREDLEEPYEVQHAFNARDEPEWKNGSLTIYHGVVGVLFDTWKDYLPKSGEAGIDNVQLMDGSCDEVIEVEFEPGCTFDDGEMPEHVEMDDREALSHENPCGIYLEDFEFVNVSSKEGMSIQVRPGVVEGVIYTQFEIEEDMCMSFNYSFGPSHGTESFIYGHYLMYEEDEEILTHEEYFVITMPSETWSTGYLNIPALAMGAVIYADQGNSTPIMIDDIRFTYNRCPDQPAVDPSMYFQCVHLHQIVPADHRCDGYGDCWDSSDEHNCQASADLQGSMYCDQFDSDCVDMTVDHKHWKAYSGPPATEDTGPVAARDVYNGDGILPLYDPRAPFGSVNRYLLFDSSVGKPGENETIKFPVTNTDTILRFNYAMIGSQFGEKGGLKVEAEVSGSTQVIWSLWGTQTAAWEISGEPPEPQWYFASVSLPARTTAVHFTGYRGVGPKSDIAIDWVVLRTSDNEIVCHHAAQTLCSDKKCLPNYKLCDGYEHCPFGEDEMNCEEIKLDEHSACGDIEDGFLCYDDHCIPPHAVCDGKPDCGSFIDESEELCDCSSQEGKFQCALTGVCLVESLRCDGQYNCGSPYDHSDELGCPAVGCLQFYQTQCEFTGLCVFVDAFCDGVNNCGDWSDESNCTCEANMTRCDNGLCMEDLLFCNHEEDCPDGSDEFNCGFETSPLCQSDQIECAMGGCVHEDDVCNGEPDCPWGTDEKNCTSEQCGPEKYSCNGKCHDIEEWCDERLHCITGEDEATCGYSDTSSSNCHPYKQMQCDSGECLLRSAYCDGEKDCEDGTDEPPHCRCDPLLSFMCPNPHGHHCIPKDKVCDGEIDCGDMSDELQNCECEDDEFNCTAHGICIESHWVCNGHKDCPDGEDEYENCDQNCGPDRFACDGRCFPNSAKCDQTAHCLDLSDEVNCTCADYEKVCDSGICIPATLWCDGVIHCSDYSDEIYCKCDHDQLRCPIGLCIPEQSRCDRVDQCPDGWDELGCDCPEHDFQCPSGRCIPTEYLCDSFDDCLDGADEDQDCLESHCPYLNGDYAFSANKSSPNFTAEVEDELDIFICRDYGCVKRDKICDGERDCEDGSDETHCLEYKSMDINGSMVYFPEVYQDGEFRPVCGDWEIEMEHAAGFCGAASLGLATHTDTYPVEEVYPGETNGSWVARERNPDGAFHAIFDEAEECESETVVGVSCLTQECGERSSNLNLPNLHIVQGEFAAPGEFPWTVDLRVGNGHICGAAIISSRWIITAAHCLHGIDEDIRPLLTMVVGTNQNPPPLNDPNVQVLLPERLIPHERFDYNGGGGYDIALIRTNKDIIFNDYVQPICLPSPEDIAFDAIACYFAGWGDVRTAGDTPASLKKLKARIVDIERCYQENFHVDRDHPGGLDSLICTDYEHHVGGTCQGDSGSGLACVNSFGRWVIQSAVSFGGIQCNEASYNERVGTHLDWIKEHIEEDFGGEQMPPPPPPPPPPAPVD